MRTILLLLTAMAVSAADAPEISEHDTLKIREAQLQVMTIQAERAALESRLKDLVASLPAAQDNLKKVMKDATPQGYVMQPDLKLVPEPKQ